MPAKTHPPACRTCRRHHVAVIASLALGFYFLSLAVLYYVDPGHGFGQQQAHLTLATLDACVGGIIGTFIPVLHTNKHRGNW